MRKTISRAGIVPVILCGGSGTRLWPASREQNPKQFLNLMGDLSLLQDTARRALSISGAPADHLVTVTLGSLRDGVEEQLAQVYPAAAQHILSEPCARNTAAAVALAAKYVKDHFGEDAIMWVLPADHHIGDENALAMSVRNALDVVQEGYLLTFGIQPTRPDTGYGYIRVGETLSRDSVRRADAFVEKPDIQMAREYLDSGIYLWNSGMFLFGAGRVLQQFEEYSPEILRAVLVAVEGVVDPREASFERYAVIPEEPFDVAIMEKSPHVAVVPSNPAWSDIGSWESLWEIRKKDKDGNVKEGRAACVETRNCFVQAKDRLIACAGVENIVVIETEDAVLIADRSDGNAMKKLVKTLKASGVREAREMPSKPNILSVVDGGTKVQEEGASACKVTEHVLPPGEILSLEGKGETRRFLTVMQGKALVTTLDGQKELNVGDNLFIEAGKVYRVKNKSAIALEMIEVEKTFAEKTLIDESTQIRNVA